MDYKSMDDVPLVISVPELANILNISRNTAYDIVRSGQIKTTRVGNQIRITKAAFEMYLNNTNLQILH